ncbi:toprim domain-containing protein [candidate division TA06 bacterium]|nr:toprim domain-containing protein [candidate division TA06 bacterium]
MYFKLRQDPDAGSEKITWPSGAMHLFNSASIKEETEKLLICEGELDCLAATANGITTVTSTHGAMNFKMEWLEGVRKDQPIYLCFDNDPTGHKAAVKHAQALFKAGFSAVHIITLPDEVGDKGDLTDYFTKLQGKPEDLFTTYAAPYPTRIDTSKFQEMGFEDIAKVLDLTIVEENVNKVIAFLAMLSAYSPDSQLNVSFNAPSSYGKTYIIQEVAKLYPKENVTKLSKCTAAAFYHDVGEYDEEENMHVINFKNTVIIFLDQPNQDLMSRLRTLLSHDDKELLSKITDKSERYGLRAKNVKFVGWPVVVYCTAGQLMDEQEATRFIILSPDTNEERLKESVKMTMARQSNPAKFTASLENQPSRILIRNRILGIQQAEIEEIKIPESLLPGIYERFTTDRKLKPRDQRDIARLLNIAKIFALLNHWFREKQGKTLVVAEKDIAEAFKIWEQIAESQDLSVAPYILSVFTEVILPLFKKQNTNNSGTNPKGITRQEIVVAYAQVFGHTMSETKLRQDILPPLEEAGLIYQEADENNRRKMLVFVPEGLTSEPQGGVK